MDRKTILILGGGVGGQVAANALAERLRGRHRIVLVDKSATFAFAPSFLWLSVGQRTASEIQRPVSSLLRRGVEFVQAEVLKIDPAARKVETSAGELPFDYLVISMGAALGPEKVPGFQEAALNLYDLEGAAKTQKALEAFTGGRAVVLISSSPFKCPAAPYEAAFLVQSFLKKRGAADVAVFTPEPYPMPTAGPKVGEALKSMLESRGIGFKPGHKVARIDAAGKTLHFENGQSASFDLLIGVPPHQAPKAARESGLVNEAGWVPVDPGTLATRYDGIYAVGDTAAIPIAGGKALPKAGIFAELQAEVVAANIADQIESKPPSHKFDGLGWCAIEMGDGIAGFGDGDFFAQGGPMVELRAPSRYWHWGKVLFEKWWLAPFGLRREALRLAIRLGGKMKGVAVRL